MCIRDRACGYFYFVNDDKKDDHIKSVPNYIVEKTGSAAIADFTDKTKQVNQVVDDVITENGATILDVKNLSKMVSRKSDVYKRQGLCRVLWNICSKSH